LGLQGTAARPHLPSRRRWNCLLATERFKVEVDRTRQLDGGSGDISIDARGRRPTQHGMGDAVADEVDGALATDDGRWRPGFARR
jgi:hypothetical protein